MSALKKNHDNIMSWVIWYLKNAECYVTHITELERLL